MTDDPRRRSLPHESVERRREVGQAEEFRGRMDDPRRITNPSMHEVEVPATREEVLRVKRQVSEVDAKLEGYVTGIESRIRHAVSTQVPIAVESAIEPFKAGLAKLEQIAYDAAELRRAAAETREYRIERDARERFEKELKARADRELVTAQTQNIPVEASLKYRQLRANLFVAVAVALFGLLAAMIKSRM